MDVLFDDRLILRVRSLRNSKGDGKLNAMYVRYTVLMAPKGNLYRVNKQLKHVGVKSFLNFHETSHTHTHTVRWLFAETTPGDFKKSVTRISPVTNNTEAIAGIWPSPAQHTHALQDGLKKLLLSALFSLSLCLRSFSPFLSSMALCVGAPGTSTWQCAPAVGSCVC